MTQNNTVTVAKRIVTVWNGRLNLQFNVFGQGPALVYLHPAGGFMRDPFLDRLAQSYTIYAPEFPGTSADDPQAIRKLDELWDVLFAYEEAFRLLGLDKPVLMGQSFGGMMAAELAAMYPTMFSRLILLDALGLWRDDAPVTNWMLAPLERIPSLLFLNPSSPAVQALFTPPSDPKEAVKAAVSLMWAFACTGRFIWPIPDRGLVKRLHRIQAKTLIIWGEQDALIPSCYAEEFKKHIADSRVVVFPNCGHIPQIECMEETYAAVRQFLNEA